ncbi:MAG: site-2 protease family protein [Planctomycetales bacterium]|jgi:Zn-dependent protease
MAIFYRVVGQAVDEPNVDSLETFLTGFDAANEALERSLEPLDDQLADLGFIDPVCYEIETDDLSYAVQVVWRHESGRAFARSFTRLPVESTSQDAATGEPVDLPTPDFITPFDDGSFILSSASASRTTGPAGCSINQFVGASIDVLWQSHQRKLAADDRQANPLETDDDVIDAVQSYHECWRDSLISDGVFVELSDGAGVETIVADSADEIVLAEMRQQSEKQSGSGMALLIMSIVLFSAVGPAAWDPAFLAILIPIILFHEAGHFVAMKCFGYRNLKMFFIPFLGAAVTGRQYNVPGWKQVIVSLAGPLPGIALGGVLLVVSQFWEHELLKTVILQLVLINALNLLPILPLDGGWVAQTLVFSRHPVLAAIFKMIAVVCLFALSFAEGSVMFGIIGFTMLISLPMGYKVERIGRKLRREGLAAPPDDDRIPDETGLRIIQELRAVAPAATTPQTLATLGLTAFERVNARPPGVLASVFFAGVQTVSLIVALVIATLAHWPNIEEQFAELEKITEFHTGEISCNEILQFPNDPNPDRARRLIVASYANPQIANFRRESVAGESSPTCEFLAIGRAIIASELDSNPASVEQLKVAMAIDSLHSFEVELAMSGSLTCEAPDKETATRIETNLQHYFNAEQGTYLVPPWSPSIEITPEQHALRELYETYRTVRGKAHGDPRVQELWADFRAMENATQEEIDAKRTEVAARQEELLKEIVRENRQEVIEQHASDIERQLIAVCDECEKSEGDDGDSPEYRDALARLGAMLGQLPLAEGEPTKTGELHSCESGFAEVDGVTLHVYFGEAGQGDWLIPALANWLCDNGCRLTKYEISPPFPELDMIQF